MHVTTKSYYAVRALVHLGRDTSGSYIPLREIAAQEGISQDFLEQLMIKLKRAGIVDAWRGPGGGYRLGPTPEEISILSVLQAAGEKFDMSPCVAVNNGGHVATGLCKHVGLCSSSDLWTGAANTLVEYFSSRKLSEFLGEAAFEAPLKN